MEGFGRSAELSIAQTWAHDRVAKSKFLHSDRRAGYSKREPNPIERETSVVWEKVLRTLWTERTTRADIAKALSLPDAEVEALVFGVLGNVAPRPHAARRLSVV